MMDKVVKSCATFLSRWRGATAQTSALAWPRGALRIVLTVDGRLGNLVLVCLDPVWIRGPRDWSDADITVKPAVAEDGFQLADRSAGVELFTGWITVAETMNLEPPAPPRPAPQPQPNRVGEAQCATGGPSACPDGEARRLPVGQPSHGGDERNRDHGGDQKRAEGDGRPEVNGERLVIHARL